MEATPDSKNAWNDASKYQFLLRIVAQLKEGKTIKWDLINMPGRSIRSLQNTWTKINKEIAELETNGAVGGTPSKGSVKKSGGRGRPKKSQETIPTADDGDDDAEDAPIPCKLAKKKRPMAEDVASEMKRMKAEENNEFAQALKQEKSDYDSLGMFGAEI